MIRNTQTAFSFLLIGRHDSRIRGLPADEVISEGKSSSLTVPRSLITPDLRHGERLVSLIAPFLYVLSFIRMMRKRETSSL